MIDDYFSHQQPFLHLASKLLKTKQNKKYESENDLERNFLKKKKNYYNHHLQVPGVS